ncbi:hypothetical protein HZC09_03975 [Candidatus Micrarchaeota archaeon]|nr:hypothetical protein [Candidatus Micrarchaeota archaeon]
MSFTTIQVDADLAAALGKLKTHHRQSYNEVIATLVEFFRDSKSGIEYDEFLRRIQQPKMKELWDNKYDEVWENV